MAWRASGRGSPSGSWFGETAPVSRLGFGFLPMAEPAAGLAAFTAGLQEALKEAA